MEYFAGSILTLVTMFIVSKMVRKTQNSVISVTTNFSQSRQHELIKYYIPVINKEINTQSYKHYKTQWSKIVFSGPLAYWIENNNVYSAEHNEMGIMIETKKIVDMMTIDKVELDKMILIVEKLTEGN